MIYFGDGETDIPCMKIVRCLSGNSIAFINLKERKIQNCTNYFARSAVTLSAKQFKLWIVIWKVVTTIIDKVKMEDDFAVCSSSAIKSDQYETFSKILFLLYLTLLAFLSLASFAGIDLGINRKRYFRNTY